MDRSSVYIETSFVSYLVSKPSRNVVIAARQFASQEWWDADRGSFDLVTSQSVIEEAAAGDKDESKKRLQILQELLILAVPASTGGLAKRIVQETSLPNSAYDDAVHIAIAILNGVQYLLSWNYKHMLNVQVRAKTEEICRSLGLLPVIICTPEQLKTRFA